MSGPAEKTHAPARPAVLLTEADDDLRRFLSERLAEQGYEVIPVQSEEEALRFAEGLGPSVIVGPPSFLGGGESSILDLASSEGAMERTLLILAEDEAIAEDTELGDDVRVLPVSGLRDEEIARRLRLVLVGRELGVEADLELHSLVGDFSLLPILKLVRRLHDLRLTGRVELVDGAVHFFDGEVMAARSAASGRAAVAGTKAFCRLARHEDGPFHVYLGRSLLEREIREDVPSLVLRALEETQVRIPPLRARLVAVHGARAPSGELALSHQDLLLTAISQCETVAQVLDTLPATDGRLIQALVKLVESGVVKLERPHADVIVVTDSTADLPPELAQEHGITVVPLTVLFGEETLRDGVDIQARDFYSMLESVPEHPQTRPPEEAEFFEHYLHLIKGHDIVAVHISEKLSQTVVHSRQAAERGLRSFVDLPEHRREFALEVFDSQNVSMGVGLLALFAARMAYRGEDAKRIVRHLGKMVPRIHMFFVVNTLDYLVRGGRIGKAQAWVGKLLGIKPILGVVGGEVVPVDRVRGGRAAHPRIVKLFKEHVDPRKGIVAAVAHARAPVWADRLRQLLQASFKVDEMIGTDIGPVVGTHAGPGCVGAIVLQPTPKEWKLIAPLD